MDDWWGEAQIYLTEESSQTCFRMASSPYRGLGVQVLGTPTNIQKIKAAYFLSYLDLEIWICA